MRKFLVDPPVVLLLLALSILGGKTQLDLLL
jgi:hypothetical protein